MVPAALPEQVVAFTATAVGAAQAGLMVAPPRRFQTAAQVALMVVAVVDQPPVVCGPVVLLVARAEAARFA
jgi:hypothetical protein